VADCICSAVVCVCGTLAHPPDFGCRRRRINALQQQRAYWSFYESMVLRPALLSLPTTSALRHAAEAAVHTRVESKGTLYTFAHQRVVPTRHHYAPALLLFFLAHEILAHLMRDNTMYKYNTLLSLSFTLAVFLKFLP
jgi:hypothetical protein